MTVTTISRKAATYQKLADGVRARRAGHITAQELDDILAECDTSLMAIRREEIREHEAECAARSHLRRAAAGMNATTAAAILNGAPGDVDAAYMAGEQWRLRVDHSGRWSVPC